MSVVTPSLLPSPPPQPFKPSFTPIVQPRELPRQRLPESFNLVTPLPVAFSLRSDSSVSLYRARMENRNVVLRVLNGEMVKLEFNGLFVCGALNCLICRSFSSDIQDMASVTAMFLHLSLILALYRLCWCHRKTQLPGFCILPGPAGTASFPARASWCGLTSSSSGYSCGRAGEQRPAQLPVAMQTGMFLQRVYSCNVC